MDFLEEINKTLNEIKSLCGNKGTFQFPPDGFYIYNRLHGDIEKITTLFNEPDFINSCTNIFYQKSIFDLLKASNTLDVKRIILGLSEQAFIKILYNSENNFKSLSYTLVQIIINHKGEFKNKSDEILSIIKYRINKLHHRREIDVSINSFFLIGFEYNKEESLKCEMKKWKSIISHMDYKDFFTICNSENKIFIRWMLHSGENGLFDDNPKVFLFYFWTSTAYDSGKVHFIKEKMKSILFKFPETKETLPARNSMEWIANENINRISGPKRVNLGEVCRKRIRVAICVSGQMRGYVNAIPSWKSALNLDEVDYDVFVHTWKNIGRKALTPHHAERNFYNPFAEIFSKSWEKNKSGFTARYPNLFKLFDKEANVEIDDIERVLSPKSTVIDPDSIFPNSVPNTFRMHYKIEKCYELSQLREEKYDLILRIRPDKKLFSCSEFDWGKLYNSVYNDKIIYSDIPIKIGHPHGIVMGDQFILADPEAANTIFRIWSLPASIRQNVFGAPPLSFLEMGTELRQHTSLAFLCHYAGRQVERFPYPIFGKGGDTHSLLDPSRIPPSLVLSALEKDTQGRQDSIDLQLMDAAIRTTSNYKSGSED